MKCRLWFLDSSTVGSVLCGYIMHSALCYKVGMGYMLMLCGCLLSTFKLQSGRVDTVRHFAYCVFHFQLQSVHVVQAFVMLMLCGCLLTHFVYKVGMWIL